MAPGLQGGHHAQLVRRGHPRVDVDPLHLTGQVLVAHGVEVGPRDDPAALEKAQLPGDGAGGDRVVSRDHDHLDASTAAGLDGVPRLGAGRVAHPHQAEEGHARFGVRTARPLLAGHGKHAERLVRHLPRGGQDPLPPRGVQGDLARGREDTGALREHHLRGTLRMGHDPLGGLTEHRHPLALGGEGDLVGTRVLPLQGEVVEASLGGGDDQRPLRGVAAHVPAALPGAREAGVAGKGRRLQQRVQRRARGGVNGGGGGRPSPGARAEFTLRLVARAGHLKVQIGHQDPPHGHLVPGQGSGLVGADDRGAAQGLDRRQPADQRVPLDHPPHPEGQGDGDDRGEGLRDDGHGERHAEDEHLHQGLAAQEAERDDQGDDHEGGLGKRAPGPVETFLQGRSAHLNPRDHPRDVADLRRRAGRDHHASASPVGDGRAGEGHVPAVPEGGLLGKRGGLLLHRQRLSGERGLLGLQIDRLEEPQVRGDPVTGCEQDDVARHEVPRRHLHLLPCAQGARHRRRHALERLERPLRPVLLDEAQEDREQDDHGDGDRLRGVPERCRDGGGHQQDDDQDVLELPEQQGPGAHPAGRRQLVGPPRRESAGRLRGIEPSLQGRAERRHHLGEAEGVGSACEDGGRPTAGRAHPGRSVGFLVHRIPSRTDAGAAGAGDANSLVRPADRPAPTGSLRGRVYRGAGGSPQRRGRRLTPASVPYLQWLPTARRRTSA